MTAERAAISHKRERIYAVGAGFFAENSQKTGRQ